MELANPWLLLLGLLAIPVAALAWWPRSHSAAYAVPTAAAIAGARPTLRVRAAHALPVLRIAGLLLLVIGIARPREGHADALVPAEGVDIALSIDISSSMDTAFVDDGNTRLDVTKQVIRDFIKGRENDRIGIVVFQDDALAISPPSLDYNALDRVVADLHSGILPDGTGIGVGIANSLTMLQDSNAASRVVILLTDGEHNANSIRPEDAAEIARSLNIRVYTIGVVDQRRNAGRGVDERLLRHIADRTGARYFVASNPEDLAAVYDEIGRLETSRVGRDHYERFTELAWWFLVPGAALLLAEIILRGTWLRRSPE